MVQTIVLHALIFLPHFILPEILGCDVHLLLPFFTRQDLQLQDGFILTIHHFDRSFVGVDIVAGARQHSDRRTIYPGNCRA